MKIAILGAGKVGGTLGKKWARAGHSVVFGVRHFESLDLQALLAASGTKASAAAPAAAIAGSDVVLFALPGGAMDEAIAANAGALAGKIIIDAANRMGADAMHSANAFAAQAPSAHVFRAFNSIGWENFENPRFGDLQADLLYCGPDGDERTLVEWLITDAGLRPVCIGGIDQAALLDQVTMLWFALTVRQGKSRHLAFKVLADHA